MALNQIHMIIQQHASKSGFQFLATPPDANFVYNGHYEPSWVIISIMLSILASYAALNAFDRIEHQHEKRTKLTWTFISAITMGFGVWGMHFIGMLALHMPCSIYYDPLTTLLSIIPGILASGVALGFIWNNKIKRFSPLLSSVLLGAGIGAMHYFGMTAIRLEGIVRYDQLLFGLSIFVAVVLSYLALKIKNGLHNQNKHRNLLIAPLIGLAVSGMHYTAMSASYFIRDDKNVVPNSVFSADTIAVLIALATVFLALAVSTLASASRNREVTSQLRDSEERWKFALEGSGDSIWDWNPQTDDIAFSKQWQEIIGCDENDVPKKGMTWLENCHPDDRAFVWSTWENHVAGNQPSFTVEFRMPSADKPWKWILARGKLVSRDDEGNPLRVIGTLTDISETKSLQRQLSQAQKLEAIGQLASGIAHEINTPIQFIGDNLSALQDNFTDIIAYQQELLASDEEAVKSRVHQLHDKYDLEFILDDSPKAIQQARDGVERVAEIVKAMKTFAHIDVNSTTQRINVHDALNNALIISRNTYKYIAAIETDFAANVSFIECYPSELNQVFLNLIINAAHAIEEKKAGTGLIRIVTRTLDDRIEILIQDNGAGIPADIQEKVFNLFFTTKEVGKGTGQGLSLSYSIIVEKHHGKLFFESIVGNGTTFHIQLPINLS
jgi:PAS domain S-box-containing protein